jgi:hypothetical protein
LKVTAHLERHRPEDEALAFDQGCLSGRETGAMENAQDDFDDSRSVPGDDLGQVCPVECRGRGAGHE